MTSPVQQLRVVDVDPVMSTAASTPSLSPNLVRRRERLNLPTPQLSKHLADLLEVAMVLAVDPNVPGKNDLITGNLWDILVFPLSIGAPDHLKRAKEYQINK